MDVAGFAEAHVLARAGEHLADPVPLGRRRFRDIFDQLALGLACLAVAYGAHVMMVQLWLRWQKLNRYALPHSDLRTHILDLARNTGVVIKDIYLLPVAEGRLSGP